MAFEEKSDPTWRVGETRFLGLRPRAALIVAAVVLAGVAAGVWAFFAVAGAAVFVGVALVVVVLAALPGSFLAFLIRSLNHRDPVGQVGERVDMESRLWPRRRRWGQRTSPVRLNQPQAEDVRSAPTPRLATRA
ncbi:MAG: hypothetical protein ACKVVT_02295 [Dehalococcoidia bacterium]